MRRFISSLLAVVTVGFCFVQDTRAAETKSDQPTIRVMLVTGVDYPGHHWWKTAPVVRDLLQQDKRLQVRVFEDPAVLGSQLLFDYDVVLFHFKNYDPLKREELVKKNLKQFVAEGKGVVAIHFACGAFDGWPEYVDLVGRIWDKKNGHDPRGPFTVKIVDTRHSITRYMKDFGTDDELYIGLTGDPTINTLAAARSKVTGKYHPMAFTSSYGKGRIFHTPLGHDARAMQSPGFGTLIRRGTIWAAGQNP